MEYLLSLEQNDYMMKYTARDTHQGCAILFQKLCSIINITFAVYLSFW